VPTPRIGKTCTSIGHFADAKALSGYIKWARIAVLLPATIHGLMKYQSIDGNESMAAR